MRLNAQQQAFLAGDLAPGRTSSRRVQGRNLSYLEAWDVKRHLIRVFGFAGFSADVVDSTLAFEQERISTSDPSKTLWNVGYRSTVRLTLHTDSGDTTYTEAAVGFASLGDRGEAHDMAQKTASSDALKRAAIYLGTQFGLSLYDSGSQADVVGRTLEDPESRPTLDTAPTATPDAPAQEEPAQQPQQPTERTDAEYVKWMGDLRGLATNPDNADRVLMVQALQNQAAIDFGPEFLDSSVTVKGRLMTYRTLCAEVAAGVFLDQGATS